MENKNGLFIPGAIVLGFILLTGGVIWAISAFSFGIGIVDTNRIADTKLYKQISFDMQIKGQQLQKEFTTAKTDVEKNRIQTEYQQFKTKKDRELTNKTRDIITKVAKQKGIKAVANSQSFIYSSIDLTNDVVKELDK